MSEAHRHVVEAGYDHMAEHYLASKDPKDATTLRALEELARELPRGAAVLDLGCGAGVPATGWLSRRFQVTGVDVSARQLALARQHAPAATLLKADMTELDFPQESFDAVVSLHAIIHVPRSEQAALVGSVYRWLVPGGAFLATWAIEDWEGEEEDWNGWGASMRWSHYDAATNLEMLRGAGFLIDSARRSAISGEEWLLVLARKPPHEKRNDR